MRALIPFIHPLGFIWLLLGLWLIWAAWKRPWRALWVPALAWFLYSIMTCTPAASLLMARLENTVPRKQVAELPEVDAIVCLGGIAEPSRMEATGFHLRKAADRLTTALVLRNAKKAPIIVLGGSAFDLKDGTTIGEADHMLQGIEKLGLNTAGVISLGLCASTHDEALKVSKLMQERGWRRIILVTSAWHMPRAMGTFKKQGIELVPAPCNYLSQINRIGQWDWVHLPHSDGFEVFDAWLHEVIGMQVYRFRGWID